MAFNTRGGILVSGVGPAQIQAWTRRERPESAVLPGPTQYGLAEGEEDPNASAARCASTKTGGPRKSVIQRLNTLRSRIAAGDDGDHTFDGSSVVWGPPKSRRGRKGRNKDGEWG
ncbi:hypothetical protein B0H16DRAFT_1456063 [Mycena metata]|uniref:Uncharacterized protein n=1 Tax=Mycena metata TaxID=1033252 RepID=A0AAD7JF38_9AGAR|nr:hypothetical protein B0H16DRAFT_1456063 [Mycena metata]